MFASLLTFSNSIQLNHFAEISAKKKKFFFGSEWCADKKKFLFLLFQSLKNAFSTCVSPRNLKQDTKAKMRVFGKRQDKNFFPFRHWLADTFLLLFVA